MNFISFIIVLFLIAGAWELHQSASRQHANSKHFVATPKRGYMQLFAKLLHLS
ncbi:hypothetical protein FD04_GL000937 [Secundilactobacillus odoratitofui DSM 19909 = JCM 15043]|uniref:Uncharacterized protein n=1 Tax=Secundilactobacillus odoratitofui DSM 19909 = JCM 15043 TaxID=1423776 RepID=A0A0R1LZR6_9LACO|nr:hypothetical protein [Secundilactobacillus odoratitofui]KRK97962.1 hypothetical protein FD04_GL000937 [Secundilactobacillus odoratitofui DSM 19909 = JCM 15043]